MERLDVRGLVLDLIRRRDLVARQTIEFVRSIRPWVTIGRCQRASTRREATPMTRVAA